MSGESQKVESDDETSIVKLESISENDIVDYDTLKIDNLKDSLGKISDDVREKELKVCGILFLSKIILFFHLFIQFFSLRMTA